MSKAAGYDPRPAARADADPAGPPAVRSGAVSPFKLASILLQYPTAALFDGLGDLEAAAAGSSRASREAFGRFLAWLRAANPAEVTRHYVATFDLRRRCALYLTYYRYGDTRKRGMAMLALRAAYRSPGFEPTADELPDYLPLVLDFAALAPGGEKLLRAHRGDLELLRLALRQAASPYADVIEAISAQLPALRKRDLARVAQAWQDGPPAEDVGLEPFAPPGYLSGTEISR